MDELLQYPMVKAAIAGAIGGALGAARADYQAFKKQDTPQKFLEYKWGVALYRWIHGAICGAAGVFLGGTAIDAVVEVML